MALRHDDGRFWREAATKAARVEAVRDAWQVDVRENGGEIVLGTDAERDGVVRRGELNDPPSCIFQHVQGDHLNDRLVFGDRPDRSVLGTKVVGD